MSRKEHIKNMNTKWFATLSDDSCVLESDEIVWSSIKERVIHLKLVNGDNYVIIDLPYKMKRYLQGKTGSCSLMGGKISVESRWIGFEDNGGNLVKMIRDESNGTISVQIVPSTVTV